MAYSFTEGFDGYLSTADLLGRHREVGSDWSFQATAGRTGGPAIRSSGAAGSTNFLLEARTGMVALAGGIGFWFKVSAVPGTFTTLISIEATLGAFSFLAGINTLGAISTAAGSSLSPFSVCDNEWHYFEAKLADIRIDEESLGGNGILAGGISLRFTSIQGVVLTIDDIIIYTNTTTDGYPVGPNLIHTLRPIADASPVDFDRSSGGINALLVGEQVLDTDDFVQSAVIGAKDLYEHSADLVTSPLPDTIHSAVVTHCLRNPDIGTVNFSAVCDSAGTQSNGTTTSASLRQRFYQHGYSTDPATAADWQASALNAALFGIRVVS